MLAYILLLAGTFGLMMLDKLMLSVARRSRSCQTIAITEYDGIGLPSWPRRQKGRFGFPMRLALLIICAFTAFRYDVGWDYSSYYSAIEFGSYSNIMTSREYATMFLVDLSRKLGITNIYFFANAFICLFFISRTIERYSKDYWLSIVLFLCFPLFYLNSLSVIRFFSALALVFYGFRYIEERNPVKYCLIVVLAGMFHKSALIAVPFYFAYNINLSLPKLTIILASSPVLGTVFNKLVIKYAPRYAVYTQHTTIQEGTKAIWAFILLGMIALVLKEEMTAKDRIANAYYNIYFMGLTIYLVFFRQGTMGHRLSLYGTIFSLLLIPKVVSLLKHSWERFLARFIIYSMCIAMFLLTVKIDASAYIPYRTIFQIR